MALEPITRQEQIIAGKNLEPITRMERFLKEYGGGSGGGSGSSVQSDWNQNDETAADFIKNKPFGDVPTGGDTLTWDGNTEGVTDDMVVANVFVWVSDAVVINANDIPEEGIVVDCDAFGGVQSIPREHITITEDGCFISEPLMIVPYDNYDATELIGEPLVIPKKGNYLMGGVGPISITIPGYTGFPGVKKMDEKYLPGAVMLYVDADVESDNIYLHATPDVSAADNVLTKSQLEKLAVSGLAVKIVMTHDSGATQHFNPDGIGITPEYGMVIINVFGSNLQYYTGEYSK